jgi:alpha-galactosidase
MIALLFTLLIEAVSVLSLKNGVGKLPTLGWNSWNAFECTITESQVLSAAQYLIDLGLKVS